MLYASKRGFARLRLYWKAEMIYDKPVSLPDGGSVMANKQASPYGKKIKKGAGAGILAFGIVFALYAWLFPLYRVWDYILATAVSLLFGRVIGIMGSGLDLGPHKQQQEVVEEAEVIPETGDPAADEVIRKGREMMDQIQEENDLIPDPALSQQMDDLTRLCGQIFKTVSERPKKAPQIRRFMDYYLPTTLKMLRSYRVMDQREVTGQNAQEARSRITKAMGVVLAACEKQLETLYHDDILDVTTDIEVLEQMLKRDGLVDTDFKAMGKEATTPDKVSKDAQ
jgi:hypothetical protein